MSSSICSEKKFLWTENFSQQNIFWEQNTWINFSKFIPPSSFEKNKIDISLLDLQNIFQWENENTEQHTYTYTGIYCVYSLISHSKITRVHSPVCECMCLYEVWDGDSSREHVKLHSLVSLKQAKQKESKEEKRQKRFTTEKMHARTTEENVENAILSIILRK